MRRRDPDELTDREREVLELLRRDFTNEQIAHRLGISLDGAKYHVSQILSKLGVATREDAAAVALGERRRWWAAWSLWAKVAGAGTVAAAAAGLVVLAWGVLRTSGETNDAGLTVEEVYARVRESVSRPGTVLHATIRDAYEPGEAGATLVDALPDTVELWIDGEAGALRSSSPRPVEPQQDAVAGDAPFMVAGDEIFQFSPVGGIHKIDAPADFVLCPRTTDLVLAFLLCGGMDVLNKPISSNDEVRLIDSDERNLPKDWLNPRPIEEGVAPAPTP